MERIIIINVYVQIVLNISLKNCKNKGLHLSHMLFWSVRVCIPLFVLGLH